MSISLRPVVLLSGSAAAGRSANYALDYRFSGVQQRSLICIVAAGDSIDIEVSADSGVNWSILQSVVGPAQQTVTINGPFTTIRVNKIGAAGSGNVRGVL